MKRIILPRYLPITTLVILLFADVSTAALRQDINGDGRVGMLDVVALVLRGSTDPADSRADYDNDGRFTVHDAVTLLGDIRRLNAGGGSNQAHQTLPEGVLPVDSAGVYAEPGATYMLTRDISSPASAIFLGPDVTLDLNGYTITYADTNYGHIPNGGFEDGLTGWDVSKAPGAKVYDTEKVHTFVGDKILNLPYQQEIVSGYVYLPVPNRTYYAMCGVALTAEIVSVYVEDSLGRSVNCQFTFGTNVRQTCPELNRSPVLGGGFVFAQLQGLPAGKYRMRIRAESNEALIDEVDIRPAMDVGVGIVGSGTAPWSYYKSILDGDYAAFSDYTAPGSGGTPLAWIPRDTLSGTITVRNGTIRSGVTGVRSWGLQSTADAASMVLENLTFQAAGINTFGVDVPQATLRNCRFEMDSPFIINRHRQGDQPVNLRGKAVSEVSGCTFLGGQGCMTVVGNNSLVHDNLFVNHQMVTNHYSLGLGDGTGTKVYNNRFEPEVGSGILMGHATNIEIYDNVFRVSSSPPTCEYGFEDYSVNAIRITDYNANPGASGVRIHDNQFYLTGRDYPDRASYIPMVYAVFVSVGGGTNYIYDNDIRIDHQEPNSKALAAAFYVGGSDYGGEYTGNTVTSNVPPVWVGTFYGSAKNVVFRENMFRRAVSADSSMLPVRLGWNSSTAQAVEFHSNRCEGMKFDIQSSGAENEWKTFWTLSVTTVDATGQALAGRQVVITDKNGSEVLRAATDDRGELRKELLEYAAANAVRTYSSPYRVTAGVDTLSVTLDSDRSVSVRAQ